MSVQVDIGTSNNVIAEVADQNSLALGTPVTLGVRPEHLSEANPSERSEYSSSIEGTVTAVEHLGSEAYIHLQLDTEATGEPLVFKAIGDTAWEIGQRTQVIVEPGKCYLFDILGKALSRGH